MDPQRNTWRRTAVALAALLLTLAASRVAAADTISLMWDASPEPTVTGYIVYIGTQSGTYPQNVNVGAATSYAFTTAVPGQLYCFAVSAYAAGPVEGSKSTEVCGYSNQRPTLTNPGAQSATTGQTDTLQLVGSDPDGLAVTYSATGLPPGLSLGANTGFISGTPSTSGTYSVTATVSDGVLTASQAFTWTVAAGDTTAPTISITTPTTSTTYSTSSAILAVGGTAADAVGVTQVTWTNDRGGSGTATGTTNWSVAGIALQSGANVITVTARDAANNTRTDSLTVTFTLADTTAPAISIGTPTSGTTFAASTSPLTVGGTASDAVGVTQITWTNDRGGSGTATGTTSWSASGIVLQSGANVITVTARDAAGNAATDALTVTYTPPDTTNPTVAISTPTTAATFTTSTATMSLGGTASDNTGVTQVTWSNNRGGNGTATGTTSWSVASITLQGGSNALTVTARDAAGNMATAILTVTYNAPDTTAPAVSIATPTTGTTFATSTTPLTVGGTASDAVGVTQVTWANDRGGSGTATGTTSWSASGIVLLGGANVITITARDAAGNTATDALTVTYNAPDTTAPVVTIAQPTSASTFASTTPTLNVSGSSSDAVGVTQVTWANNRGGNGNATGTASWTVNSVPLQSGSNVITITARDAAGNASTKSLTVDYAAPLALTNLTANLTAPQIVGTPITFTAAAVNGTAPYSYKWFVSSDGVNWTMLQNWSASNTYTWTPTAANSAFRIGVWVRSANNTADSYDNAQSNGSIAFPVNPASQLTLTGLTSSLPSGQPVGTPITFTATASGGFAPYQYKWFVSDGKTWVEMQAWSTSNTWTWTPTSAGGNTRVAVWVRSAGSTVDAYDNPAANGSISFGITGGGRNKGR
jgi:hypothetical protein